MDYQGKEPGRPPYIAMPQWKHKALQELHWMTWQLFNGELYDTAATFAECLQQLVLDIKTLDRCDSLLGDRQTSNVTVSQNPPDKPQSDA